MASDRQVWLRLERVLDGLCAAFLQMFGLALAAEV
jgi:hypothetical protein